MFLMFAAMVERQFTQTIKNMQSNNGTKFNCLRDFFYSVGIIFQTSYVGTPQKMGGLRENINIFCRLDEL